MKKLLPVFIAVVFFARCNKNDNQDSNYSTGVITGRDITKCYCCWGWFVDIDDKTYLFDKIPSGSSLDLTAITYPTIVKIKWRPSQTRHCDRVIDVLDIALK